MSLQTLRSIEGYRTKLWARLLLSILLGTVGIFFRWGQFHLHPVAALLISGGAVVAAAFLLAWMAEALHMDIGSGMAIAVLALIAVLPEYAVDFYYTWHAAHRPEYLHYAAANMTGANRLLIGVGWSTVVLLSTMVWRKSKSLSGTKDPRTSSVTLEPSQAIEWVVLLIATAWSFVIPMLGRMTVWHGVGMVCIFAFYVWRIRGKSGEEPELVGVASLVVGYPTWKRRLMVFGLLGFAAGVLLACAEPFAESILSAGASLHIDQFLLAQWLAPLASEAPELLVAIIFSLRGHGQAGLAALLSSKVNQWTLLVGTLPFVYSMSRGELSSMPIGDRQTEELVLTAAQGLLGIAVLSQGRMERWQAAMMLILFCIQIPFPDPHVRYGMSALYMILAVALLFRSRKKIVENFRYVFFGT